MKGKSSQSTIVPDGIAGRQLQAVIESPKLQSVLFGVESPSRRERTPTIRYVDEDALLSDSEDERFEPSLGLAISSDTDMRAIAPWMNEGGNAGDATVIDLDTKRGRLAHEARGQRTLSFVYPSSTQPDSIARPLSDKLVGRIPQSRKVVPSEYVSGLLQHPSVMEFVSAPAKPVNQPSTPPRSTSLQQPVEESASFKTKAVRALKGMLNPGKSVPTIKLQRASSDSALLKKMAANLSTSPLKTTDNLDDHSYLTTAIVDKSGGADPVMVDDEDFLDPATVETLATYRTFQSASNHNASANIDDYKDPFTSSETSKHTKSPTLTGTDTWNMSRMLQEDYKEELKRSRALHREPFRPSTSHGPTASRLQEDIRPNTSHGETTSKTKLKQLPQLPPRKPVRSSRSNSFQHLRSYSVANVHTHDAANIYGVANADQLAGTGRKLGFGYRKPFAPSPAPPPPTPALPPVHMTSAMRTPSTSPARRHAIYGSVPNSPERRDNGFDFAFSLPGLANAQTDSGSPQKKWKGKERMTAEDLAKEEDEDEDEQWQTADEWKGEKQERVGLRASQVGVAW